MIIVILPAILKQYVLTFNVYSKWSKLYKQISKQYDSDTYINYCESTIIKDWCNGIPVIKELVNTKQYDKAEKIVVKTLSSYLRYDNKKWDLEKVIIFPENKSHYNFSEHNMNLLVILNCYSDILNQINRNDLIVVIAFQINIFNNIFSFTAVQKEYHKNEKNKIIKKLYSQWKQYIVKQTLGWHYSEDENTWVDYFLETIIEKGENYQWGTNKICDWINRLKDYKTFTNEKQNFSILTQDINKIHNISEKYKMFYNNIVVENCYSRYLDDLENERVKFIKKYDTNRIFKMIMNIWILHSNNLVPDPRKHKNSNYYYHVKCLQAVMEINPEQGNEILKSWELNHKRRTNLWKELKKNN